MKPVQKLDPKCGLGQRVGITRIKDEGTSRGEQRLYRFVSTEEIRLSHLVSLNINGSRTLLVVISGMIDTTAYWIAPHQVGVIGLQEFRYDSSVPHSGIEPQIVGVRIKDHGHAVVDG